MNLHDSAATPPFSFPESQFAGTARLPPYLFVVLVRKNTFLLALSMVPQKQQGIPGDIVVV